MLEHVEMRYETEAVPATATHGTRQVTGENQHMEWYMTFGHMGQVD